MDVLDDIVHTIGLQGVLYFRTDFSGHPPVPFRTDARHPLGEYRCSLARKLADRPAFLAAGPEVSSAD